jgi:hypothetical protein
MTETLLQSIAAGDVLSVRTGGWMGTTIRLGAALAGKPNLDNHIVVAHHKDAKGVYWGVEGRPGGVGWADLSKYASSGFVVTNRLQVKTKDQRVQICAIVQQMLGTPYDWTEIAQDALTDLHLPDLFAEKWKGGSPGHVVCSSLAAWAYGKVMLPRPMPNDPEHVQPGDWTNFDLANKFN